MKGTTKKNQKEQQYSSRIDADQKPVVTGQPGVKSCFSDRSIETDCSAKSNGTVFFSFKVIQMEQVNLPEKGSVSKIVKIRTKWKKAMKWTDFEAIRAGIV